MVEFSGISHDNVAVLQVKEDSLMREQTVIEEPLLSHSFDIVSSNITEFVSSINTELTDIYSSPSLSENDALPINFGTSDAEKQHFEGYEHEVEFVSELAKLVNENQLTAATVAPNNSEADVELPDKLNQKTVEEVEIGSNEPFGGGSVRRDLYTFYENNQPATGSLENINGMKPVSSRSSFSKTSFSSLTRSSNVGAKYSAQDVLHITGYSMETSL